MKNSLGTHAVGLVKGGHSDNVNWKCLHWMSTRSDWKRSAQGLLTESKRTNQRDFRETGADPLGHCSLSEEGSLPSERAALQGPRNKPSATNATTTGHCAHVPGPSGRAALDGLFAKELSSDKEEVASPRGEIARGLIGSRVV